MFKIKDIYDFMAVTDAVHERLYDGLPHKISYNGRSISPKQDGVMIRAIVMDDAIKIVARDLTFRRKNASSNWQEFRLDKNHTADKIRSYTDYVRSEWPSFEACIKDIVSH
jgi:hypothetical protein